MSNHEITFAEWGRSVLMAENQAADFDLEEKGDAVIALLSSAREILALMQRDLRGEHVAAAEAAVARATGKAAPAVRERPAKRSKPAAKAPALAPVPAVREESAEIEDDASESAALRPLKRNNEWLRTLGVKLEERGIGAELTSHDLQAWGESTMQVASQRAKRLLDAGVLERLGRGAFRLVRYPEIG